MSCSVTRLTKHKLADNPLRLVAVFPLGYDRAMVSNLLNDTTLLRLESLDSDPVDSGSSHKQIVAIVQVNEEIELQQLKARLASAGVQIKQLIPINP